MDMTLDFAILVGIYTGIAAAFDLKMRRIPNYVTVPAALIGLGYHALMPSGMGVWMSLAGFAVGFSLLLLPWLLGGGGMGDVKLLAALGTWLGPLMVLVAFGVSAVLASFMSILVMMKSTMSKGIQKTRRQYMGKSKAGKPRRAIPFAIPVALSTWLMLAWMVAKQSLIQ